MAGEYRWDVMHEMIREGRIRLLVMLGGVCEVCGEDDSALLDIHHLNGKTWQSNQVGPYKRIKLYEQDIKNGECSLLCKWCHNNSEGHIPIIAFVGYVANGVISDVESVR